jgi:ferredoxin hydrogenase large subunit
MQKIESVNYASTNAVPKADAVDKTLFVQVDETKCQSCGTCQEVCSTGAIQPKDGKDGPRTIVDPAACMNCGQCLANCPYEAIHENVSFLDDIEAALADPNVKVVSMPAPAVRYGLGECFGYPTGAYVGGKMFTALRKLGFDKIWDNQMTADVTIMEEGTELLNRLTGKDKAPLPQFTSCCPGWIKFAETFYPQIMPNLSSCKSPIGMLGPLCKTYGAEQAKIDAKKMYTVSIMPCIAKKFEGLRPEIKDIDATITTRELAYLIKKHKIDFKNLKDSEPDFDLGESTGAGTIFGNSGGVMEAALRLAYEVVSGEKLTGDAVNIKPVRTHTGVQAATIDVPKFGKLNVCVISGLHNAVPIIQEVIAGKSPYHFIEVMTCPGGCVNGAGQPLAPGTLQSSLFRSVIARMNRRFNMRSIG